MIPRILIPLLSSQQFIRVIVGNSTMPTNALFGEKKRCENNKWGQLESCCSEPLNETKIKTTAQQKQKNVHARNNKSTRICENNANRSSGHLFFDIKPPPRAHRRLLLVSSKHNSLNDFIKLHCLIFTLSICVNGVRRK